MTFITQQQDKLKFAYVNFFASKEIMDPYEKLTKYSAAFDFLFHLTADFSVTVFDCIGVDVSFVKDDVQFFYQKKRSNSKWSVPFSVFLKLRTLSPDVIYIQGLGYNHYIAILRLFISLKTKIIVHDHANRAPTSFWKRKLFRWGDRSVHRYCFTSFQMARPWLENGLISATTKIIECVEGSTRFQHKPKILKKKHSFLWVGRLDQNKDPMTVLEAFAAYFKTNPLAKLSMVYDQGNLEAKVKNAIATNGLEDSVTLVGAVSHATLENIYNQHEYFVLASHKEGGPFSLIEAMACGCVPILTKIPAFEAMTNNGDCGYLFPVGNNEALLKVFLQLEREDNAELRKKVLDFFQKELSHTAIARKLATASV